jgi:hypothetical protein
MTALARRRVLSLVSAPAKRKPGTWGPLSPPVDVLETERRAAWTSFLTRGGQRRDHSDLTDLRALARAIRATPTTKCDTHPLTRNP